MLSQQTPYTTPRAESIPTMQPPAAPHQAVPTYDMQYIEALANASCRY